MLLTTMRRFLGEGVVMDWERVAEIEGRAEKATPGPWEHFGGSVVKWPDRVIEIEWIANGHGDGVNENLIADGEFMAEARSDVPWLCERLRELQAAIKSLAGNSREVALDCGVLVTVADAGDMHRLRSLLPEEKPAPNE
jgi:hypothetical protein